MVGWVTEAFKPSLGKVAVVTTLWFTPAYIYIFFFQLFCCDPHGKRAQVQGCVGFFSSHFQPVSKHPSTQAKLIPSSSNGNKVPETKWLRGQGNLQLRIKQGLVRIQCIKGEQGGIFGAWAALQWWHTILLVALSQICCWLMHKMKQQGLFWLCAFPPLH